MPLEGEGKHINHLLSRTINKKRALFQGQRTSRNMKDKEETI